MSKNKIERIRLVGRISKADFYRLEQIKMQYGFRSSSQILSYLTECFLRVADPANEIEREPVSKEIEDMFADLSNKEAMSYVKPKRRCNKTINE